MSSKRIRDAALSIFFLSLYLCCVNKKGSSGKWSDKFSIEQKKTAEHWFIPYLE